MVEIVRKEGVVDVDYFFGIEIKDGLVSEVNVLTNVIDAYFVIVIMVANFLVKVIKNFLIDSEVEVTDIGFIIPVEVAEGVLIVAVRQDIVVSNAIENRVCQEAIN